MGIDYIVHQKKDNGLFSQLVGKQKIDFKELMLTWKKHKGMFGYPEFDRIEILRRAKEQRSKLWKGFWKKIKLQSGFYKSDGCALLLNGVLVLKLFLLLLGVFLVGCSRGLEDYLVSMVARPQEPAVRPYQIKEIKINNPVSGNVIAGELTYPPGNSSYPALVLISGRDNGSPAVGRDYEVAGHNYFLVISHLLTMRGYAVLRVDNRGVNGSSGDFETASDDDLAKDSAAALSWLRAHSGINVSSSGFLGHSQGAVIALLAARLEQPDYIISLAGLSLESPEKFYLEQNERMNAANGMKAADIKVMNQEIADIISLLKASATVSHARTSIHRYAIRAGLSDEQKIESLLDSFATQWWFDEVRRSTASLVADHAGPILSLYGSKDLWVSAENNAQQIERLFVHHKSVSYTFEGLNHLFQTAPKGIGPQEYWEIEQTINENVIGKIQSWQTSL